MRALRACRYPPASRGLYAIALTGRQKFLSKLAIPGYNQGVASGDFRSVDAKLAAKPLLGALNWTSRWYQPRDGETQANKKKLAQSIADFVTAGLETKD